MLARQKKSVDNIEARLKALATDEQEEYAQVDAWLARYLQGVTEKREELNKAESEELAKAAKSTPLPLLSKRASSIIKHYREKRKPLLRKEERAKISAEKKKDSIRVKRSRQEQVFHKKLAEVRMNYGSDIGVLNTRITDENIRLSQYRETESRLISELQAYSEVSFAVYLRRIAFLP